jgi:hypothetical protein
MSVRVRYSVKVKVSSNSDSEAGDLGNLSYEVVDDQQGEGGARKFTLAAGAVDTPIDLGNVADAKMLFIRTNAKDPLDDPVTIELNYPLTTNDAIPVKPLGNAKEGHFMLSTDSLTALFASNPGAIDMELTLVVVGD